MSITIRNDIEQVIEDEKWNDPGHQTGEDRSRSKSAQEEHDEGNRADTHKRHDSGRDPYHYDLLLLVYDMRPVNRWVGILAEIKCPRLVVTNLISPFSLRRTSCAHPKFGVDVTSGACCFYIQMLTRK